MPLTIALLGTGRKLRAPGDYVLVCTCGDFVQFPKTLSCYERYWRSRIRAVCVQLWNRTGIAGIQPQGRTARALSGVRAAPTVKKRCCAGFKCASAAELRGTGFLRIEDSRPQGSLRLPPHPTPGGQMRVAPFNDHNGAPVPTTRRPPACLRRTTATECACRIDTRPACRTRTARVETHAAPGDVMFMVVTSCRQGVDSSSSGNPGYSSNIMNSNC